MVLDGHASCGKVIFHFQHLKTKKTDTLMKMFETKMTVRICFFYDDVNNKFKRIIFHYTGTNLVTYRVQHNTVTVITDKSKDGANFQFLKRCAHKDWGKYFSYTNEDNILKVTFKPSITAIDVKTTKKDPGWGVKFDSISFKGL